MCLLIRNLRQNPAKPFNSSNFRWRIFQKTDSGEYKPVFYHYDFKKMFGIKMIILKIVFNL